MSGPAKPADDVEVRLRLIGECLDALEAGDPTAALRFVLFARSWCRWQHNLIRLALPAAQGLRMPAAQDSGDIPVTYEAVQDLFPADTHLAPTEYAYVRDDDEG